MRRLYSNYIHQHKDWPDFYWNNELVLAELVNLRHRQGRVQGYLEAMGFVVRNATTLDTLTSDVLKSSEIEGEFLNADQVRSSVARHLGLEVAGLALADRTVDGVVEMMVDATQNYTATLTATRLYNWHAALFPTGRTGMHKITVGAWRKDDAGPMQVVSGAMGKERVHFEAPHSKRVHAEMKAFLKWFNAPSALDPVLKSALAHLWFLTVHPFDDGNGRIARALADLQLARADADSRRFYSMSAQIRVERKTYYETLERTQKGTLDVTEWMLWYLQCMGRALSATEHKMKQVLRKNKFFEKHQNTVFNERQRKMINLLFDGFEGKLSSSKWAKINKCSADTALRDIQDLVDKKALLKEEAGGRSTSYVLHL